MTNCRNGLLDTTSGGAAATATLITYEVGGVAGPIMIFGHGAAALEAQANIAGL